MKRYFLISACASGIFLMANFASTMEASAVESAAPTEQTVKSKVKQGATHIGGQKPAPAKKTTTPTLKRPSQDPERIFDAVEQPASFPGGQIELMKWISTHLKYPEAAQENDIQGRVIVKFCVEKDGSISNVTVLKGVDKDLDEEAVRVASQMPKWNPGMNNGVVVRTYFTLPVSFKLHSN